MKTEHNTKLNVSVSRIKDTISFEIQDNVWEMIREDYKSFMTNKLTMFFKIENTFLKITFINEFNFEQR